MAQSLALGGGKKSSYPASVIAAGLQAVWDLRTTAGTNAPLVNTPAGTPGNLPAVCSVGVYGQNAVLCTGTGGTYDLSNWDFTGYNLVLDGTGTFTGTNNKFTNQGGIYNVGIGTRSGAPTVNFTHCSFDGGGPGPGNSSLLYILAGAVSVSTSHFYGSMGDPVIAEGTSYTSSNNYYEWPGQSTTQGSYHLETIYVGGSTMASMTYDLSDMRAANVAPTNGVTGFLFNSSNSSGTITIQSCILIGAANSGASQTMNLYASQIGTNTPYTLTLNFFNNVWQKGSSGYNAVIGNGTTNVTESGNIDFDTSAAISP